VSEFLQERITSPKEIKRIAEALGVTVQAVSSYKNGTAHPKTENLIKIAEYYGVSLDYIVGLSSVKSLDASVQVIGNATGLTEKAINVLRGLNERDTRVISKMIEAFEEKHE